MIENFILEKLIELIPIKNKGEIILQNTINSLSYIPKGIDFTKEVFKILNKIKKEYNNNNEININLKNFKKLILGKSDNNDILYSLYLLSKSILFENYEFDKNLNGEMAEIDKEIALTSLEIQIEELLSKNNYFNGDKNIFNINDYYKKIKKNNNNQNNNFDNIIIVKENDFQINNNNDVINNINKEIINIKQTNEELKNKLITLNNKITEIETENIKLKNELVISKTRISILESTYK